MVPTTNPPTSMRWLSIPPTVSYARSAGRALPPAGVRARSGMKTVKAIHAPDLLVEGKPRRDSPRSAHRLFTSFMNRYDASAVASPDIRKESPRPRAQK